MMADLTHLLRGAMNYDACGIPHGETVALDNCSRRRMRLYFGKASDE